MNKLPIETRIQILNMLCEGSSLRSISRITGASTNTVSKLLEDAGEVCATFHDERVRGVNAKRVQVDEAWAFCYAKQKNVATAKAAPEGAGDIWTWVGLETDTKLAVSYFIGGRDGECAKWFMNDVASRLANRIQLTSERNALASRRHLSKVAQIQNISARHMLNAKTSRSHGNAPVHAAHKCFLKED